MSSSSRLNSSNKNTKHRKPHKVLRILCLFALMLLLSLQGWACQHNKPKGTKPSKSLLGERVKMFNTFLRWRSYARAKMLVAPKKRSDYIMAWEQVRTDLKIMDLIVRDVTFAEEGKEAYVIIVARCQLLPSPYVKRMVYQQHWKADKKGQWYFSGERKAVLHKCKRDNEKVIRKTSKWKAPDTKTFRKVMKRKEK